MWVCRTRSKTAHLVTTIAHPETIEVANHLIGQGDNVLTAELVHPEELMSGLLSQVPYLPYLPTASPLPKRLPFPVVFPIASLRASATGCPPHCVCLSLLPHCYKPTLLLLLPTAWCFGSKPDELHCI